MKPKELPVLQCTLDGEDLAKRAADIQELLRASLIGYEKGEGGLRLRFKPEANAAVQELVAQERECCSFLSFKIDSSSGLVLEIAGPVGAQPIVDSLVSLFPLDLRNLFQARDMTPVLEGRT